MKTNDIQKLSRKRPFRKRGILPAGKVRIFICLLIGLTAFTNCEMSRTVPMNDPAYQPKLIIHGMASPLSGAFAVIQYNEPLPGMKGRIPELPLLEVVLLRDGDRYLSFTEDSTGHFRIPPEDRMLEDGRDYALEVRNLDAGVTYVSSDSRLPPRPELRTAEARWGEWPLDLYSLRMIPEPVKEPVKAMAVYPVLLDSTGQPAIQLSERDFQRLTPWYKIRSNVQYFNAETWTDEKEVLLSKTRYYRDARGESVAAEELDLYVSYLSPELTAFVRDMEEMFYSGEDIFQAVRPVYSNFPTTPGAFGLYNEVNMRLEIEE